MLNIIAKKNLYFIISGLLIIPGFIFLIIFGLLPSIDFTGGSQLDITVNPESKVTKDDLVSIFNNQGVKVNNVKIDKSHLVIRTEPMEQVTKEKAVIALDKKYPGIKENTYETVGATVGNETQSNAVKAVIIASLAILAYIAIVFQEVSRPVASWKFGVCAIAALLHDVLVVVGLFAILGYFFGVEVDSLFITALLTVMGFSVHDTIVVFDRIRENLKKNINLPFEEVVNNSILETLNRSLNTSLTVLLVLFILLLFGGENIRWFIVALLIGIASGTYSSIFNASPLLVVWYEWDKKKRVKK